MYFVHIQGTRAFSDALSPVDSQEKLLKKAMRLAITHQC